MAPKYHPPAGLAARNEEVRQLDKDFEIKHDPEISQPKVGEEKEMMVGKPEPAR
jgi:thioredoxin 1